MGSGGGHRADTGDEWIAEVQPLRQRDEVPNGGGAGESNHIHPGAQRIEGDQDDIAVRARGSRVAAVTPQQREGAGQKGHGEKMEAERRQSTSLA